MRIICKQCYKNLTGKSLLRHYEAKHPIIYRVIVEEFIEVERFKERWVRIDDGD